MGSKPAAKPLIDIEMGRVARFDLDEKGWIEVWLDEERRLHIVGTSPREVDDWFRIDTGWEGRLVLTLNPPEA